LPTPTPDHAEHLARCEIQASVIDQAAAAIGGDDAQALTTTVFPVIEASDALRESGARAARRARVPPAVRVREHVHATVRMAR